MLAEITTSNLLGEGFKSPRFLTFKNYFMNATEQLFVAEQKMAYVKTCLRGDLDEWERKEYTSLMYDYEVEIAALTIHIETNKELFNELPGKKAMYPDGEIKIHDGE